MLATFVAPFIARMLDPRDERGQGMVEYALIIALVSIVVVATLLVMGQQLNSTFQSLVGLMQNPSG
jgi:pilus assembly protein Flp/PilA